MAEGVPVVAMFLRCNIWLSGVEFLCAELVRVLDRRVEVVNKVEGRRGITRIARELGLNLTDQSV